MGVFSFLKRKPKAKQGFAFAYIDPSGKTVIWSSDNYATLMTETYLKNVIAFQCINMISKCISSVPWYLMTRDSKGKETEVMNDPLSKLFLKANIYETWREFLYKTNCYYLGAGNAYLWKLRVGDGEIKELFSLRPDRIQVQKNNKNQVIGFQYDDGQEANKQEFPFDLLIGECDILHLKTFHPLDDFYGMPIAKPSSREIDISNESNRWNMKMMVNDARPGMIVLMKGFLPQEKYDQLLKVLSEEHSGADNAGKSLILESEEGIVDVKPYNWSPKDIEFIEGGRETARRIALGYSVPPMMLGIPGDNTYSNYKEARAAFWEDTIIYYLDFYKEAFNGWLFRRDDLSGKFIDYDLNDIPALGYKQDLLWERQFKAADILKIDERRALIGFDPLPNKQGEVILVSASMIPLEAAIEPPEPESVVDGDDEDGGEDEGEEEGDDDYEEGDEL